MNDTIKRLSSVAAGAIAAFFGQYGLFFLFVALAIVIDVATGLIRAKAMGEGLSSEKAIIGFWKKTTLLAGLLFGIFLDYAAGMVFVHAGINLGGDMPFALIVCAYIIINEAISVCENLYLANPDAFPKWVAARLKVAKGHMERDEQKYKENTTK